VPFGGLGTKPRLYTHSRGALRGPWNKPRVVAHRWRPSGALELGF